MLSRKLLKNCSCRSRSEAKEAPKQATPSSPAASKSKSFWIAFTVALGQGARLRSGKRYYSIGGRAYSPRWSSSFSTLVGLGDCRTQMERSAAGGVVDNLILRAQNVPDHQRL